MQKKRRNSQETIVQRQSRVLVPPQGIYLNNISLSSFAGTKAPTQVEDGNFMVSTRFLEHRPVTSPPSNQKKVTHPAALASDFAYKNNFLKTIGEFMFLEHELPILLAWPFNRPFSAPNSDVRFVWPHCVSGT